MTEGHREGWSSRIRGRSLLEVLDSGGIFALIAVLIIAGILSPVFYQPANLFNVLRQASALGI
jgi:ribose/xylose/arabinose/galactoside ABC-type transport system permease subunit